VPFAADQVVVIGDTPRDIECARHFGAVAVAVATGQYSREALEAEGPDLLFEDLATWRTLSPASCILVLANTSAA
jgi:phosphoglycolate phosphatase-like HAD superfamily hydrolase